MTETPKCTINLLSFQLLNYNNNPLKHEMCKTLTHQTGQDEVTSFTAL